MLHHFLLVLLFSYLVYQVHGSPIEVEEKMIGASSAGGSGAWSISIGSLINVPGTREEREKRPVLEKRGHHLCGGIMLNPTTVLTVGYCVEHAKLHPEWIGVSRSGQGKLDSIYEKGRIPVKNIMFHPKAAMDPKYNVALLTLTHQISSTYQNAANVSTTTTTIASTKRDINLRTVGWGSTTRPKLNSDNNQWTNITILNVYHILSLEWFQQQQQQLQDGFLYTQTSTRDSDDDSYIAGGGPCLGDQGAPLFLDTDFGRLVLGIAYWPSGIPRITTNDQLCTGQSVFLDLGLLFNWISTQTIVNRFEPDET